MSNKKIILDGCIQQFEEDNELDLNKSEIFELFSLFQIFKNTNLTFENIQNSIVDGSDDGGIDSIILLLNDMVIETSDDYEEHKFNRNTNLKIIFSQCKKEKSFKESPLEKLIVSIQKLFDLEYNENELLDQFNIKVVMSVFLVREIWLKTIRSGGKVSVDFIYVTNAEKIETNKVFKKKVEQLEKITNDKFSIKDTTFQCYSSEELLDLYQKQLTTRLELEFKDQPLFVGFDKDNQKEIGYIGMVILSKYKEFLTSEDNLIREEIFENNVRHFQGNVDVNKSIKNTIVSDYENDFWWLNNGVTIIAEDVQPRGKQLFLDNVQIVNGLQTSYSIFNSLEDKDDDFRSVLVKIIINSDKKIIDNIISSTNRQTPVSAILLKATETIQRELEMFFLTKGYFYDRRKNYYKNQGKPLNKIFSIQYTAQSIEAILFSNPHGARANPTTLLKKDESYNRIFNPNQDFQGYLNCCLFNKKAHDLTLKIEDSSLKSKMANFKLHIAWMIPQLIKRKIDLNFNDILSLTVDDFKENIFNDSVSLLSSSIDTYLVDNNSNIINIAKLNKFTTYLKQEIGKEFENDNKEVE